MIMSWLDTALIYVVVDFNLLNLQVRQIDRSIEMATER